VNRPHFANLFAVHDVEPRLAAFAADLETSGEFADVRRPAPGWVVASAPLAMSAPDPPALRANALAFAEGRDRLDSFQRIAEIADDAPERLASFPGDFGFIRFRPNGEATFVRSCGGLVPFYFSRVGQRIAIGTRLGDFVRYLPEEPELDGLVNAIWLTGCGLFPDNRTFFKGISILSRGHFARVTSGRIDSGRYWDPRPQRLPRPTPQREKEHAERLRALLIDKLERELDPDDGNLLTLSGGVDSSSLAALAAGTLGRRVWTWSLLPAPKDLYDHEMSFIEPLAKRYGFARRWEVRFPSKTRIDLMQAGPRVVFHVPHPALCSLPHLIAETPIRVLFGGEFADEICGSVLSLPDWAIQTSPWRLLSSLRKLPTGRRNLLGWGKHQLFRGFGRPVLPFPGKLASVVRATIQSEYSEWLNRRRQHAGSDRRPLSNMALHCEIDGFVAMNWETASTFGIRRVFPFFHRDVLELAFECHSAERVGPGTKKLLRSALHADVPQRNLERLDKGGWGTYLRNRADAPRDVSLPETLNNILNDECWPAPASVSTYAEAVSLTQLLVFSLSIEQRRATASSEAFHEQLHADINQHRIKKTGS
jgi:asparagine synthetase B (glutamine-hydrolysing)